MSKRLPVVAIIGRPNVGKSTLFNRLLGQRRAIVSDTPGTTRDRVEGIAEWNGQSFRLIDTAGFDTPGSDMEMSMQEQVVIAREQAEVIVIVLDSSTILSDADARVIKSARQSGKPLIVAANKADRKAAQFESEKLGSITTIPVSAVHGTGSGDLLDAITARVPKRQAQNDNVFTVSLLGRPNVGKSSLLNAMAGESRAIVSDTPGTTRDVNQLELTHAGKAMHVLDTAGLRRQSKRGHYSIERFSALRSQQAIEQSDVCVLVLDATELVTAQDQRIASLVKETGRGLIVAVNKWDITDRDDEARRRIETELMAAFKFAWWAPLLLLSAHSGHNVPKLLPLAMDIRTNQHRRLGTRELNQWLQGALGEHPPAGLKNRRPKLNYVTQTAVVPPTFAVFGAQTPFLHWSYKRYLETRLRESFDFSGTPIRLQWRSKHKQQE